MEEALPFLSCAQHAHAAPRDHNLLVGFKCPYRHTAIRGADTALIPASVAPGVQPRVHKAQPVGYALPERSVVEADAAGEANGVQSAQISGIHANIAYDFIRKDTQSWYYPIEISAKLLHFITTGNKDQTTDMFALIHRENVEERSLPLPLLNMLLSDLKNTLFKARFQVLPPQSEEMAAKLKKLDERLYSPAPTFAQLEDDALCLCEFFVKVSSPSTPIPDVERYLQENYTDPSLCLSKVGDRFNISDTYLSHMFKEKTGQNFSVYLERLRMNEAARRLTSGDCNLTVLYADLGYTNPTSFRRAFKKYYGMTPSEMRDQPRRQEEKSE